MLTAELTALAESGSCIILQLTVLKIPKENNHEKQCAVGARSFSILTSTSAWGRFLNLETYTGFLREQAWVLTVFLHEAILFNLDSIHSSSMRQNLRMWRAWPNLTFALRITNKDENKHFHREKEEIKKPKRKLWNRAGICKLAGHMLMIHVITKHCKSEGGNVRDSKKARMTEHTDGCRVP